MKYLITMVMIFYSAIMFGNNENIRVETIKIEIQNSGHEGLIFARKLGPQPSFYLAAYSQDTLFKKKLLTKSEYDRLTGTFQTIFSATKQDRRISSSCGNTLVISQKTYRAKQGASDQVCIDLMDSTYRRSFEGLYKRTRRLSLAN